MAGVPYEQLFSAVSGFSLALLIAKWAITRSLADLDRVSGALTTLEKTIAGINVRLERLEAHETLIRDLLVRVSFLEGGGAACRITERS